MDRIAIFVAEGTEDIELIVPYDVWTRAGLLCNLISIHDKKSVKLSSGAKIGCNNVIGKENLSQYNIIYLPGGKGHLLYNENVAPKLIKFLKKQANNPKIHFLAMCAAPKVYGQLGMTKDVKITCYPTEKSAFEAIHVDDPVVVDQNFITANGPGSAYQFAFKVTEELCGVEKANEVKSKMLYQERN